MADSCIADFQDHQLFDRAYYLEHNQDLATRADIDPLKHYFSHGGWEGRDPHPLFDSSFYLEQNPQVAHQQINPLIHFLTEGARQGLDPHPLFSTSFYLEQGLTMEECSFNPLIHYLESGAQEGFDPHPFFDGSFYLKQLGSAEGKGPTCNPLVHYLTVGAQRGLEPGPGFDGISYCKRYPDVTAARVNPLLHYVTVGQSEGRIGLKSVSIKDVARSIRSPHFQAAWSKLRAVTTHTRSHLIVTGCLLRGGSERCVSNFARAIAQRVGDENVLILVMDRAEVTCQDWLPERVSVVNLARLGPLLSNDERAILLLDLLTRMQPAVAIGMNSPVFWSALDAHVGAWKNELSTKLVGYLGNYETYVHSNECGFIDGPIARLTEHLDLFVTDNVRLRDAMIDLHRAERSIDAKVVTCYKSLEENLHRTLACQSRLSGYLSECHSSGGQRRVPPKMLWASRLDEVKQVDVLRRIAEVLPDVQFDVYGRLMPAVDHSDCLSECSNVRFMGEYTDFSAIPKHDKVAFLYTSRADSMPHVLIEAAASGLPIISANTGGICELIDERTGWLISRSDDVAEYVRVIRYVLEHPETALERALNLQSLVNERHNWSAFLERVDQLDIWDPRSKCSSESIPE